jgi:dTDP-4-dehydrorhamnose reductase
MAGHVVCRWLKERGHHVITHVYRTPLDDESAIIDLYNNVDRLDRLIENRSPDVIVHCVGLLPAECNAHPDRAAYLNGFLPRHLAMQCRTIHISTDCVFSGKMGSYMETSDKDAQSVYGISKSLGEIDDDKNLTIRTSIVGPEIKEGGTGLLAWFQRQTDGVDGWPNAFWNGVTTLELAKFVEFAIEEELVGLCHLHSKAPVSKFQLLKLFRQVYRGPNVQITARLLEKPIDKTLVTTRDDFEWEPPEIEGQLQALREWYSNLRRLWTD